MKKIYTFEPIGNTGGRHYLRQVQAIIPNNFEVEFLPDFKRMYLDRRWRKIKHLFAIRNYLPTNNDAYFLWDDISIILFNQRMLKNTIFIFHHHDKIHYDSSPIEHLLWTRLFQVLKQCSTVVTCSDYWQKYLMNKGIRSEIIYNSFDLDLIKKVNMKSKSFLKCKLGFSKNKLQIYLGKAVHAKGAEIIYKLLKNDARFDLVTTGSNTLSLNTLNFNYPYYKYLQLIRTCDVGIFNSQLKEGWSRCAAEAILLFVPTIVNPIAGLGDLANLTCQSHINLKNLKDDIISRSQTKYDQLEFAYEKLAQFNLSYFKKEWLKVLDKLK